MITINDLINYSSKSRYELMILLPQEISSSMESMDRFILIHLALQIVIDTELRPLPNPEWLIGSPEAQTVFGNLINYIYVTIEQQKLSTELNKTQLDLLILLAKEDVTHKTVDDMARFSPQLQNVLYNERFKIKTMMKDYVQSKETGPLFHLYDELCEKYILSDLDIYKRVISQIPSDYLDGLAKVSLLLYSTEFVKEESGAAHIMHFYEGIKNKSPGRIYNGSPRGSEYLSGYDSSDETCTSSFVQTNHGIGSGVYGMQRLTKELIDTLISSRRVNFCIVTIESPLRLDDGPHCGEDLESDTLTRCSKYLMHVGDLVKNEQIASLATTSKLTREEALKNILALDLVNTTLLKEAQYLSRFKSLAERFDQETIYLLIVEALSCFIQDSRKPDYDMVPMPINYLINQLGFTGVISKTNDALNRGLIAMNVPDNWYQVPVKHYATLFPTFFADRAASPRVPTDTTAFKQLKVKKMIFPNFASSNFSIATAAAAVDTNRLLIPGSATDSNSAFTSVPSKNM